MNDLKLYRVYVESKTTHNIYDVIVLAEHPDFVYAVLADEAPGYEPFGDVIEVVSDHARIVAWQKLEG